MGTSRPGELDDPVGHQITAQYARERWSNPTALIPKHESPETSGQTRVLTDSGPSHPGQLVNPEGLRTQAPVAQDS